MTPDERFEAWLAAWREVSSQCWARPGLCCKSCRVEALGGPARALRATETDAEPPARTRTSPEPHGGSQSPIPTDHETPRRAAA